MKKPRIVFVVLNDNEQLFGARVSAETPELACSVYLEKELPGDWTGQILVTSPSDRGTNTAELFNLFSGKIVNLEE